MKTRLKSSAQCSVLSLCFLAACAFNAHAQRAVVKVPGTNAITENLNFGSGKILRIEAGATINATGATITGFGSAGGGDALTTNPLSQFAATTSAQLRGVLTDASGTGVILTSNGSAASLTSFPTLNQSTTGNAATATLLQTPRAINGYNFDGAADITITCAAGTLTGSTLASGVTASSLTSVGTITSGTWQGSIVAPAYLGTGASITTKYLRGDGTWQTISGGGDALTTNPLSQFAATTSAQLRGVLTDASGTGVILTSNGSAASLTSFPTLNQSTTGNAATATLLQTPRAINGYNFDGAADITITCAAGTLTGSTLASGVTASSLTSVGTITSGTWSGSFGAVSGANLITLNASNLSSGTVATARLGTGTADSTTYLRGDGSWQTVTSGATLSTNTFTGLQTITQGTNSATPVMAANLINNTASISGTQSASPALVLTGHGYRTGNSTDYTLSARNYLLPVQGSSGNPAASIVWGTNVDGGAYTDVLTITPGVSGISGSLITLTTPSGSGAIVCAGGMNVGNALTNGGICGYWTCTAASGAFASSNRAYPFSLGGDVVFVGDAANILARRNGTTAQADRIYNTYTSSTVGEWLTLDWKTVSNVARIATEKGSGGGSARDLRIDTDTVIHATFKTNGDVLLNFDELPTSDPVVKGQLWRSGTALQISAGP